MRKKYPLHSIILEIRLDIIYESVDFLGCLPTMNKILSFKGISLIRLRLKNWERAR